MSRLIEFLQFCVSIVVALFRLFFLMCAMFTSALHLILFTKTEIYNVELRGQPLLCDRQKFADQLSFIDSLCISNQELLDYADEHTELPPDTDEGGNDI